MPVNIEMLATPLALVTLELALVASMLFSHNSLLLTAAPETMMTNVPLLKVTSNCNPNTRFFKE